MRFLDWSRSAVAEMSPYSQEGQPRSPRQRGFALAPSLARKKVMYSQGVQGVDMGGRVTYDEIISTPRSEDAPDHVFPHKPPLDSMRS